MPNSTLAPQHAPETNPLVASGEYIRSYVCELEPGDVTVFDETVQSVERVTDERTIVTFTNGHQSAYGRASSTMLVKSAS